MSVDLKPHASQANTLFFTYVSEPPSWPEIRSKRNGSPWRRQVGDKVQRGQKVAVVEAMKMENDILASKDGTVTAIHVSKGDSVLEGASIISIE